MPDGTSPPGWTKVAGLEGAGSWGHSLQVPPSQPDLAEPFGCCVPQGSLPGAPASLPPPGSGAVREPPPRGPLSPGAEGAWRSHTCCLPADPLPQDPVPPREVQGRQPRVQSHEQGERGPAPPMAGSRGRWPPPSSSWYQWGDRGLKGVGLTHQVRAGQGLDSQVGGALGQWGLQRSRLPCPRPAAGEAVQRRGTQDGAHGADVHAADTAGLRQGQGRRPQGHLLCTGPAGPDLPRLSDHSPPVEPSLPGTEGALGRHTASPGPGEPGPEAGRGLGPGLARSSPLDGIRLRPGCISWAALGTAHRGSQRQGLVPTSPPGTGVGCPSVCLSPSPSR